MKKKKKKEERGTSNVKHLAAIWPRRQEKRPLIASHDKIDILA
jgi:hypothetical protein